MPDSPAQPPSDSFTHRIRVRWAEADPQGIVFNAHYLTYADVAFTEFMRARGLPYPSGLAEYGVDLFLAHSELDYRAPARFDDELDLVVEPPVLGNSSIRMQINMLRAGQLLVECKLVYVVASRDAHQPQPIPDLLRQQLSAQGK